MPPGSGHIIKRMKPTNCRRENAPIMLPGGANCINRRALFSVGRLSSVERGSIWSTGAQAAINRQ
ncbi:MAG: hypothetical protein HND48_16460 [Chloroflexi bacterium]|nr:hypothetical protein [Chloroflexota bacterium]GIK27182.1 MAG: hypothetical protein BroJett007_03200 [Chloroflexota bacterium]